ncbi:amino acid ABC transporter substrate-binding protein [Bacillota bacterium Meth-B3]|nr:amino acid ABC transporter substrate-binding protein [Christensenellaceae bacterium]MEA5067692.1 amino acid ABC transporter substrate-binding protein [Christensenellaceae bacterium]
MKRIFVLVLVMLLALGATAMAKDGSVEAIKEKGTLVMGLDDSFPPMGYRDENNEIVGYDVDLAKEVCARLGVELKLQPIEWAAKELELSSGNIDCIWNGMSITPAREESMAMSFPYLNNEILLYAKADSGIGSIADMAGKKIAVQSGSFAEEVLDTFEQYAELRASVNETLRYDEYLTALMDLQAGGVDAVLIDKVVAEFRIKGLGDESIVPVASLADDNFGVGFRKGDVALRDEVQNLLVAMAKDGTAAKISTEWFGADISTIPAE